MGQPVPGPVLGELHREAVLITVMNRAEAMGPARRALPAIIALDVHLR